MTNNYKKVAEHTVRLADVLDILHVAYAHEQFEIISPSKKEIMGRVVGIGTPYLVLDFIKDSRLHLELRYSMLAYDDDEFVNNVLEAMWNWLREGAVRFSSIAVGDKFEYKKNKYVKVNEFSGINALPIKPNTEPLFLEDDAAVEQL